MAKVQFTITNPAAIAATLEKAVQRVAMEVMRDARDLAPRSPHQPPVKNPAAPVTGTLGNSITISKARTAREVQRHVGTTVPYGVYQEFGTSRIPPRPFLGPALEKARRKYG